MRRKIRRRNRFKIIAVMSLLLIMVLSKKQNFIDVPELCQLPNLPTGCEATAAAMVLQYFGENITPEGFVNDYLFCEEFFWDENGNLFGGNPDDVFIGNPFSENGYGCYAGAICRAVNENIESFKAEKLNMPLSEICEKYIENKKPVLIWATIGMKESQEGTAWNLKGGGSFTWISGEHCLVLIGFDDKYYYFNDPQVGTAVAYSKKVVEKRYSELGSQAVLIERKED